ncbi:MAG: LPS assembly lipoprotein LptE, partial [Burkholderiales bacterium]
MKKTLTALLFTLLLASCGFQLRGAANLPFDTLYVQAPASSQFANQFRRMVTSGSTTRVINNAKNAEATFVLVSERREKTILSLSTTGRVSEYQLRYLLSYRVIDRNSIEIIPVTEIALKRDLSYSDAELLSKEAEDALLYRDMQNDALQQLLRRLQLTKLSTTPAT